MSQSSHHHFMIQNMLHSPMSKIYIFQAFIMFVKGMIGLFAPVYMYSLGYTLSQILFYFIVFSVTILFMPPIAIFLINKIGFKGTIIFTLPFYFLFIFFIKLSAEAQIFAFLAWVCFGIYIGNFWPCFHSEIAVNGTKESRGKEIGNFQIITISAATLAPLIGGYFLKYIGYDILLVFAFILLIMGGIPLLLADDIKLKKYHFGFKDYIRLFKSKKYKNSKKAFMAEGVEFTLAMMIWPIIIFIILKGDFFFLGTLLTFVSFVSVVIIAHLKKTIDIKNKKGMLNHYTKIYSISWFFRSIVIMVGNVFIFLVEPFAKLAMDLFRLSYNSIFYNNAKAGNYMDYIITRELYLHGTKIFFLLAFMLLLDIFGENFLIISFLAIIGSVVAPFLNNMKEY